MGRRLIELPAAIIILGLVVLGAILGFVLSQEEYLTASRKPTQLEPLPAAAATFLTFETDWFYVDMYVKTTNEKTYANWQSYNVSEWRSGTWETKEPLVREPYLGELCTKAVLERFERTTGTLLECRYVSVPAEWCASPLTWFAIDQVGNVWHMGQPRICGLTALFAMPSLAIGGGIIGIILVLLRWLYLKRFGKTEAKP
jgi:hypothetical protein